MADLSDSRCANAARSSTDSSRTPFLSEYGHDAVPEAPMEKRLHHADFARQERFLKLIIGMLATLLLLRAVVDLSNWYRDSMLENALSKYEETSHAVPFGSSPLPECK